MTSAPQRGVCVVLLGLPCQPTGCSAFWEGCRWKTQADGKEGPAPEKHTHALAHTLFSPYIQPQLTAVPWYRLASLLQNKTKEFKELRKVQMTPHAGSIMTFPSLFSFGPDKVSQTKRCECSQRQLSTCVFYVKKCLIKKMLMKKRICSLLYNTF